MDSTTLTFNHKTQSQSDISMWLRHHEKFLLKNLFSCLSSVSWFRKGLIQEVINHG